MRIAPLDDGRDHDLGSGFHLRGIVKQATTTKVEWRCALNWCILFLYNSARVEILQR